MSLTFTDIKSGRSPNSWWIVPH